MGRSSLPWQPVDRTPPAFERRCIRAGPLRRPVHAALPFTSLLIGTLAALTACGDLTDRGVVARAGDWTLTEERLAELLVLAQPFPLDSVPVGELVDHWVAAAAMSQRAAAGDSLLGSEALEAAVWAVRREAILAADREQRLGGGVVVTPAEAEAVHREGALRLVAQVFQRAGPEMSSSMLLQQQRTADRLLQQIADGGSWIDAVAESEDEASKPSGGVMGLFGPGELPSTLDRVTFRLEPGQVSPVTQSSQGFHIIYRPTFPEVEFQFIGLLRERRLAEADAAAAQDERTARSFAVVPGGAAVLARIAEDPAAWLESRQPLATWEARADAAGDPLASHPAGQLTAGMIARDFHFVPPQALAQWAETGQEQLEDLITDVGTRALRIADAAARGMSLDPVLDESFFMAHADRMEYWTRTLALGGADGPSRDALARHMAGIVSREEPTRVMSPLFEAWLLERVDTRVRKRGMLAAIVQARAALESAGGTTGTP
ncbi:MAG: hypothetical protein F4087_02830 [Gemmatimonadetes bacterium]|nr:hypothetical protein [Gemmatimonadota bacterium]